MAKRGPRRLPYFKCSVDNCDTLTNRRYKHTFYCEHHLKRIYAYGEPEPSRLQDPSVTGKSFCYKCETEKDVSEFAKLPSAKFGISRTCVSCKNTRYDDKQCSVDGCESTAQVKNKINNNYYCKKHNERLKNHGHEYLLHGKPKGRRSFIHTNWKPVERNSQTFFCRNCGEEKKDEDRYGISLHCKGCMSEKASQKELLIRSLIPNYRKIKEMPSYLLRLSNKEDVERLTSGTENSVRRTMCKADGCFDDAQSKWRFCTKHRYFFERLGSEVPPKTLSCPCCHNEKDIVEFFVEGTYKINTLGRCNQCIEEKRKESKRNKNRERRRRLKINNPAKWQEIKRKRNKKKMERIKNDPTAYAKHRKHHKTACINRRARKTGNGGTHTSGDIQFLIDSQKGKCVCCRKDIRKKYHIDHIIPIALGGGSEKENLQLLCPTCNTRKCAKHPTVFMQEHGYLL